MMITEICLWLIYNLEISILGLIILAEDSSVELSVRIWMTSRINNNICNTSYGCKCDESLKVS